MTDFRCACIPNADHTAIVRACLLHEQWAKATYGPTMRPVVAAPARPPLDAYGPMLADGRGKASTS